MGVNTLFERDGVGITDEDSIDISTQKVSTLLCIEVPMK
jgi:hypothetical protein